MSVTPEVSHVEMWPYIASAAISSLNQEVTSPSAAVGHQALLDAARRRRARGAVEHAAQAHAVAHAPAEVLVEGRGAEEHPLHRS